MIFAIIGLLLNLLNKAIKNIEEFMKIKIAAIITASTKMRVIISEDALQHSIARHFHLIPKEIVLEVVERVLKDPSDIFVEQKKHLFYLFYRFDTKHYMVVVVKHTPEGDFFVTTYPTGQSPRIKHKNLKRISL